MEDPPSIWQRLFLLLPALALAYGFILRPAQYGWTSYWLLTDGQQGKAVITKLLWSGHNVVTHRYQVNGKEYTGTSARNWQDPKYENPFVGQGSVVYFSASHPWLSQWNRPRTVVEGLPVPILAWLMLGLMLVTIINPRHKWALANRWKSGKASGQ
jgi:hypothetical protein